MIKVIGSPVKGIFAANYR